jgi:hypothetical protein
METSLPFRSMTTDAMLVQLKKGKALHHFHKGDTIEVSNKMSKGYSYTLTEAPGTNFAEGFTPYKTPGEMLSLGVFGGKYLNDCIFEFPKEWFVDAIRKGKLSPEGTDIEKNFFSIDSRLPLSEWKKSGWVPGSKRKTRRRRGDLADPKKNPDERGWFQWYCRYWMGRRIEIDAIQIQRWKNFKRHFGAVRNACKAKDLTCRPRQRQALLQWAWNYEV